MRLLATSAFASLALLGACQKQPPLGSGLKSPEAVARVAASMPNLEAEDFLQGAVGADIYAIKAAQIAMTRAQDPKVKALAQDLAFHHADARTELGAAVARSGQVAPLPDAPTDKQQALLDQLGRDPQRTFDRTYVEQQVQMQEERVSLLTNYADSGDVPAIKAAAASLVPEANSKLADARALEERLDTP